MRTIGVAIVLGFAIVGCSSDDTAAGSGAGGLTTGERWHDGQRW